MAEDISKFLKFSIRPYGDLQKITPTISSMRCRIFYKYANRNGTYITDEFADKLIKSLPYTPIKGIYSVADEDYTDHGVSRDLGRIYGIVPKDPNFAWERHEDDDGVARVYACCDVYLYTAIYKEASEILDKGQSMELYDKSIKGTRQRINGKEFYVFQEGCFLGLQALGDDVEPCFEGAAFYSLKKELETFLEEVKNYTRKENIGGHSMPTINFKISDREKFDKLWNLLNTNYTEENNWAVDFGICDIYDSYAIVNSYENGSFERVYYNKTENDQIEITKREPCFIVDVSESEKAILDSVQKMNGGTFEKLDEVYSSVETLKNDNAVLNQKNEENAQKIVEGENTIATLQTERDTLQTSLGDVQTELNTLKQYKLDVETNQKEEALAKYSSKLDAETINKFKEKLTDYTVEDLKKELAYTFVESNPSAFDDKAQSVHIPKHTEKTGIAAILDRYK